MVSLTRFSGGVVLAAALLPLFAGAQEARVGAQAPEFTATDSRGQTETLEPVINFAPVNPMESARLSQSDWDSGGNSECIPCHISRAPRFTRVLSIRATHAAPQS
jgi:hypothetical protein